MSANGRFHWAFSAPIAQDPGKGSSSLLPYLFAVGSVQAERVRLISTRQTSSTQRRAAAVDAVSVDGGRPSIVLATARPLSVAAGLFVGVALSSATPAHAYRTFAQAEGLEASVHWARAAPSVALAEGLGATPTGRLVRSELPRAVAAWSAVSCASIAPAVSDGPTPDVVISVVSSWVDAGYAEDAAATTELVLQTSPTGQEEIVAAGVFLNGDMSWGAHPRSGDDQARDMRAVLVHELGHVLGLAHPCDPDDPDLRCEPAHLATTMSPIYRGAEQADLDVDDMDGLCALYPEPVELSCDSTDECMEGERCVAGACEDDALYGVACDTRSDCPSSYCVAAPASASPGVCTRMCIDSDECPSGTVCAPVEDAALSVCAPMGRSGCSFTGTSRSVAFPLWWLAVAALTITLIRRRHSRLRATNVIRGSVRKKGAQSCAH